MENSKLKINEAGYITNWLISGPWVTPYYADNQEADQLAYEKHLREIIRDCNIRKSPKTIMLGERFLNNMPWRYYYSKSNWFVDLPAWGSGLNKMDACAVTELICEKDMFVEAVLWTYTSIDIWVNDIKVCVVEGSGYKPINMVKLGLSLKKGANRIFVRMQGLMVRDGRNMFGLQLKDKVQVKAVAVSLPDMEHVLPVVKAANWLDGITYCEGKLVFSGKAPCDVLIKTGGEAVRLENSETYTIEQGVRRVKVLVEVNGQLLERVLEFTQNVVPVMQEYLPPEQNKRRVFDLIADKAVERRGDGIYYTAYQTMARFATGKVTAQDYEWILEDLQHIDERLDCSEFFAVGLLRLAKLYDLGECIKMEMKRVLLNYRYWMDEEGADGMCFWSENHALMFYGMQLVAGGMYPEELFTRSGRTGAEQRILGEKRCRAWLDDVEKYGFEEFLSAAYIPVTLGALLNLIDFAPEDISKKATAVLDRQMEQIALHTFKGSIIGPQGRVYRDVLYPFEQPSQAIVNFIDAGKPYSESWWLAAMATSKYKLPASLTTVMERDADTSYDTGNAKIVVYKKKDYMLTSVLSPRNPDEYTRWTNIWGKADVDKASHEYTKSLNEKFHGTTAFAPGCYGYQQHFGYAALTSECVAFTNHPGATADECPMRPGYWYGNGVMPAQRQIGNELGTIYVIPEYHPIHFTHLYWPMVKFDETKREAGWLFGKKGDSYLAVWCSLDLTEYDDMLFDCEFRAVGSRMAYFCKCSSNAEAGTFESFIDQCRSLCPVFDEQSLELTTAAGFKLIYEVQEDTTQFV